MRFYRTPYNADGQQRQYDLNRGVPLTAEYLTAMNKLADKEDAIDELRRKGEAGEDRGIHPDRQLAKLLTDIAKIRKKLRPVLTGTSHKIQRGDAPTNKTPFIDQPDGAAYSFNAPKV